MRRPLAIAVALVLLASGVLFAADRYKDIALHPDYDHNRFGITPMDLEREFRAYTVSFDGNDDDNNDGQADHWAIPHWVAYEIKAFPGTLPAGPDRPNPWLSEQALVNQQTQATDASYHCALRSRNRQYPFSVSRATGACCRHCAPRSPRPRSLGFLTGIALAP